MNWFVLLVRTASEDKVLDLLKNYLDDKICTPFIPTKIWPHVGGGGVHKVRKICFPGYVFLRSEESAEDFMRAMQPIISKTNGIYYFLYHGDDKNDIAMRDDDRHRMEHLLNAEFCMEPSLGFMEGDRVKIVSGALVGRESEIIKVNKRKRTATIEIEMLGEKRTLTLMLEVLEKV